MIHHFGGAMLVGLQVRKKNTSPTILKLIEIAHRFPKPTCGAYDNSPTFCGCRHPTHLPITSHSHLCQALRQAAGHRAAEAHEGPGHVTKPGDGKLRQQPLSLAHTTKRKQRKLGLEVLGACCGCGGKVGGGTCRCTWVFCVEFCEFWFMFSPLLVHQQAQKLVIQNRQLRLILCEANTRK